MDEDRTTMGNLLSGKSQGWNEDLRMQCDSVDRAPLLSLARF